MQMNSQKQSVVYFNCVKMAVAVMEHKNRDNIFFYVG